MTRKFTSNGTTGPETLQKLAQQLSDDGEFLSFQTRVTDRVVAMADDSLLRLNQSNRSGTA
jgi:hypothetical protein